MNERILDVLSRLPDAQAMTAIVQSEWRAEAKALYRGRISHETSKLRAKFGPYRRVAANDPVREHINRIKLECMECHHCKAPIVKGCATIDHLIPLSRGGRHTVENVVGSCRRCNLSKGAKLDWKPTPTRPASECNT